MGWSGYPQTVTKDTDPVQSFMQDFSYSETGRLLASAKRLIEPPNGEDEHLGSWRVWVLFEPNWGEFDGTAPAVFYGLVSHYRTEALVKAISFDDGLSISVENFRETAPPESFFRVAKESARTSSDSYNEAHARWVQGYRGLKRLDAAARKRFKVGDVVRLNSPRAFDNGDVLDTFKVATVQRRTRVMKCLANPETGVRYSVPRWQSQVAEIVSIATK